MFKSNEIKLNQYYIRLTVALPSFGNPWTCNLVFITSKGHTNVAAITPTREKTKKSKFSYWDNGLQVGEGTRREIIEIPAAAPAPALQRRLLELGGWESLVISWTYQINLKRGEGFRQTKGVLYREGYGGGPEWHCQRIKISGGSCVSLRKTESKRPS